MSEKKNPLRPPRAAERIISWLIDPLVRDQALERPYTVVLTERAVKKYFGTEDPIGKFLKFDNRTDFLVTGAIKDVPRRSHLRFDLLCSLESDPT